MIPEFSRPVQVARLGAGIKHYQIEADSAEKEALARHLKIRKVDFLRADISLSARKKGTFVHLTGRLVADVVQECVVSLADALQHIEEEFSLIYVDKAEASPREIDLFFDESDPPEMIDNGIIDIGEVTTEHLALALDPFPRASGAVFEDVIEDRGEEERQVQKGAFDALAQLKQK